MGDVSKIIPEIFYDLIGRFIPGLLALLIWPIATDLNAATLLTATFSGLNALGESLLAIFVVGFVLAYIIGHLVSPISSAVHSHIFPRLFASEFSVLKNAAESGRNRYPNEIAKFFKDETSKVFGIGEGSPTASQYRRVTFLWYDWIRINNPTAGTRLAKMRAEYRMLEGTYVVLGITLLLYGSTYILEKSGSSVDTPPLPFFIVVLVVFVITTWGAVRLFQTYQWSVINHYYHLRSVSTSPGVAAGRQ